MAGEAYVSYSTRPSGAQSKIILGDLQVQSTSVDMQGLVSSGLSLNVDAVIYNPNDFGATLKEANYSVYANGRYVGTGQTSREYDLGAGASLTMTFPVSIGWTSAFETTGSYFLSLGHVTWTVKGTAEVEIGGVTLRVAFQLGAV
jgi:LEA14-like dessication related protein